MRRRGLFLFLFSVALVGLLAGGAFLLARTRQAREQIRLIVETALSRELELPVKVEEFSLSLRLNRIEARRAAVLDPGTSQPLLEVDRVVVDLDLSQLLSGRLTVKAVALQSPRLAFDDTQRTREILSRVASRLSAMARERPATRLPVTVVDGQLRYEHGPAAALVELERLQLSLRWESRDSAIIQFGGVAARAAWRGKEVIGAEIDGELQARPGTLGVNTLRVRNGESSLSLQGVVREIDRAPALDLAVTGALSLSQMASLLSLQGAWEGQLSIEGRLSGAPFPDGFAGQVTLAQGTIRGLSVARLRADVAFSRDRIELYSVHGAAAGGTLSGRMIYEPSDGRYEGRVEIRDVRAGEILEALGYRTDITARATGSLEGTARGRGWAALSARFRLASKDVRYGAGARSVDAVLRGSAARGVLTADELVITRGKSRAEGKGTLNLATRSLAMTVAGSVEHLGEDLWPVAAEGVMGRLAFAGRLSRTLSNPLFSGRLRGDPITVHGRRFDLIEGPVEVERGRIASTGLRVVARKTTARFSGEARVADLLAPGRWRESLRLAGRTELKGRAEDLLSLVPVSWPLTGPVGASLSFRGSSRELSGGGKVEMPELRRGNERWGSLKAALTFKGKNLTVPFLVLMAGGQRIEAQGEIDLSGRYRFYTSPARLNLAALPGAGESGAQGTLVVKAFGAGEIAAPRIEGTMDLTGGGWREIALGDGGGRFELEGNRWRWELAFERGYRARGTLPVTFTGPFHAEITAAQADITGFLAPLRRPLRLPISARGDGRLTLEGTLPVADSLTGQIELTALSGTLGEVPWKGKGATRLTVEQGAFKIVALDLEGPDLSVIARGAVRPNERLDLEISGRAPFPILAQWAPAVAGLKGSPSVTVKLAGPPGRPSFTGRADLRGTEVRVKALPFWFAVKSGEVAFDNERVRYEVSEGTLAGGRLTGKGEARRAEGRWSHQVEFEVEKADLDRLVEQARLKSPFASGALFTRGSLAFETGGDRQPLSTVGGSVALKARDGNLSHYPALVRIFGLLSSPVQPWRLPDLTKEQMPYSRLAGEFTVSNGVMETKGLVLDSKVVRASAVGKVSLPDWSLDMDLAVQPLQVIERGIRNIPIIGRIIPKEQSLAVVYFDMTGPLADPQVIIAPVKTLGQSVVEVLLLLLRAPERLLLPER